MDRTARWPLHNGHVLGGAAFLVPTAAIYIPLALAPMIGLAALAAIIVRRLGDGSWPRPARLPVIVFCLAMAWSAASFAWSLDGSTANFYKLIRLAALLAAGLVVADCAAALRPDQRRMLGKLLLAGFAAAIVFLAIDRVTEGALRRLGPIHLEATRAVFLLFNRSVTVLALLVWPVALVAWRRNPAFAVAAWAITLGLVMSFESNAAVVAIAGGGAVAALTLIAPRLMPALVALGFVVVVMASPFAARQFPTAEQIAMGDLPIPNSAYHRMLIWRFTADRIMEHPVLGWGFNASKSIPGRKKTLSRAAPALPLHPHNAALQWWLELGLAGAVLGAVLTGWLAWRMRSNIFERAETAAATALASAGFAISALSYGAWQSWWLAAMFFAAGFMVGTFRDGGRIRSDRR